MGRGAMRLYRGLTRAHRPGGITEAGTDFTDCPATALLYARGPRGVLLVADVPPEAQKRVTSELWLNVDAGRFMIWGPFEDLIVAAMPASELRAQMRACRLKGRGPLELLIEERLGRA